VLHDTEHKLIELKALEEKVRGQSQVSFVDLWVFFVCVWVFFRGACLNIYDPVHKLIALKL
jgi:hypothetical protein